MREEEGGKSVALWSNVMLSVRPLKIFIGFSSLYHNTKEFSVTVGLLFSSALKFGGGMLINQRWLSNQH